MNHNEHDEHDEHDGGYELNPRTWLEIQTNLFFSSCRRAIVVNNLSLLFLGALVG
jgi:hypothetical protein